MMNVDRAAWGREAATEGAYSTAQSDATAACGGTAVSCDALQDAGGSEFTALPAVFPELSDAEILAVADGAQRTLSEVRNRFDPYLIEIGRRGLYSRRGCRNLRDFAYQTVGLGRNTLRGIASVWRGVQDKPVLKELFLEGSVGWSKIRVVLSLATAETDSHWARAVRSSSKAELETMIRGLKEQQRFNEAKPAPATQASSFNVMAGLSMDLDPSGCSTSKSSVPVGTTSEVDSSEQRDGELDSSGSHTSACMLGRRQGPMCEMSQVTSSSGLDTGSREGKKTLSDAGLPDAGLSDAGLPDAGLSDAGLPDAGLSDAGLPDAGLPGSECAPSDTASLEGSGRSSGASSPDVPDLASSVAPERSNGRPAEDLEDWPLIDDAAFLQLRGNAPRRKVNHPFDVAALDLLKRYQERLSEEMGCTVSASQALQHALCRDGSNYRIKVILFSERETGLLFGRSQWGAFRTAASLYGACWAKREECVNEGEWMVCEKLLESRADSHRRKGGGETTHGPMGGVDDSLPGEQLPGPTGGVDDSLPGERTRDHEKGRRLPARVRRFIIDRYDGRCAFLGCNRKMKVIHHSNRWGVHGQHRLEHLHPLCAEHHGLVHRGLIDGEDGPIDTWRILGPGERRRVPPHREEIDHLVQVRRRGRRPPSFPDGEA